jgi:hypothetical protein
MLNKLRATYDELLASKYELDPTDLRCPVCKQKLPKGDADKKHEEHLAEFNQEKAAKLSAMGAEGKALSDRIKSKQLFITSSEKQKQELEADKAELEKQVPGLSNDADKKRKEYEDFDYNKHVTEAVIASAELNDIAKEIESIKESILNRPKADTSEYEQTLSEKKQRHSQVITELSMESVLASNKKRIDELKVSEKAMAQEMALIEKEQFLLDEFVAKKTTMLQEKVNAKFEEVNFKMFEIQINGGLSPTCKAIYKGVDIADVNNAGRIQAGIDIIRTLCEHYGVYCCIWIDNCESITMVPETKSQQIRLYVDENYKELTVK